MSHEERKPDAPPLPSPYPETLEALLQAHLPPSLLALPQSPQQLLAMARDRLPALRAELEFWQLVVARAGQAIATADTRFPAKSGVAGGRAK